VLGKIKPEKVAFCHSHEHLFLKDGQPGKVNPALILDNYSATKKELKLFKDIGGTTIVDAQPIGSGRDEKNLVKVSEETSIDIIASTGFHKFVFYPKNNWLFDYSKQDLTDVFVHELTKGMFINTEMEKPNEFIPKEAGQIKVAIDEDRLNSYDKKWFY